MDEILSAISTVGFPIVSSLFMGYLIYYIIVKLLKQLDEFNDTLNKLNETMSKIIEKVDDIENKLK